MESQDTTQVLQSLHAAGVPAREWIKDSYHRIYVSRLVEFYGLECDHYSTGSISHATLDGDIISNGRARKLTYALDEAKLWWDAADGKWHARATDSSMAEDLLAIIKAKLA